MKGCPKCMTVKPLSAFNIRRDRAKPRPTAWCRECNYPTHRKADRKRWTAKYATRRAWLDKLKSVPCADCGGSFPSVCMDFDHVRGDKRFRINASTVGLPEHILAEELKKCEVVCSNCHRLRTARRGRAKPWRAEARKVMSVGYVQ